MKEGWKTTEFWMALVGQVLALCMLTGVVTPDQGQVLGDASGQIIGGVMAVISGGSYAISRGLAKKV
jgi:hypothetical protein